MAILMMHVIDERSALEALLHVFRKQMDLGHQIIAASVKHKDGTRDWMRGDIEVVLKDECLLEPEYHDIIILEHCDDKNPSNTTYIDTDISLKTMMELYRSQERCCTAVMPRLGPHAIFLFKDEPMVRYTLLNNYMISHRAPLGGLGISVINNMCGMMTCEKGLSHMIQTEVIECAG